MRSRVVRLTDNPMSSNKSTGICGVSATYKINKKRNGRRYLCYSILIGPDRVVSRSYNDGNKDVKLVEAVMLRKRAIELWPNFSSADAASYSRRIQEEVFND